MDDPSERDRPNHINDRRVMFSYNRPDRKTSFEVTAVIEMIGGPIIREPTLTNGEVSVKRIWIKFSTTSTFILKHFLEYSLSKLTRAASSSTITHAIEISSS